MKNQQKTTTRRTHTHKHNTHRQIHTCARAQMHTHTIHTDKNTQPHTHTHTLHKKTGTKNIIRRRKTNKKSQREGTNNVETNLQQYILKKSNPGTQKQV